MQADVTQIDRLVAELQRGRADGPPSPPPLNHTGGGGNYDPMEPRVAKLEAHMEHVRAELTKLNSVPVDLATLKTKVEHLPGKGFIVSAAGSTIVLVTGLLVLLQKVGVLH